MGYWDYDYEPPETWEESQARQKKEAIDAEEKRIFDAEKERLNQIWRDEYPLEAKAQDECDAKQQAERLKKYDEQEARRRKEESRKRLFGCFAYCSIIVFIAWMIFYRPPADQMFLVALAAICIYEVLNYFAGPWGQFDYWHFFEDRQGRG